MAAVIATKSCRSAPIATSSPENTEVQDFADAVNGLPVSGSTMPTAWKRSASSDSAGL